MNNYLLVFSRVFASLLFIWVAGCETNSNTRIYNQLKQAHQLRGDFQFKEAKSVLHEVLVYEPNNPFAKQMLTTMKNERAERQFKNQQLNREVEKKLEQLITVDFKSETATEVFKAIEEKIGVTIVVDWEALKEAGISQNTTVEIKMTDKRIGEVIQSTLGNIGAELVKLEYWITNGRIVISTRYELDRTVVTRVYDVRDIISHDNFIYNDAGWFLGEKQPPPKYRKGNIKDIVIMLEETGQYIESFDSGESRITHGNGYLIVRTQRKSHKEIVGTLWRLRERLKKVNGSR